MACGKKEGEVLGGTGVEDWEFDVGDIIQDIWGSVGEVIKRDTGPPRRYYYVYELKNVHKKVSLIWQDGKYWEESYDNHGRFILWPVNSVRGRWKGNVDDLPENSRRWLQRSKEAAREKQEGTERGGSKESS